MEQHLRPENVATHHVEQQVRQIEAQLDTLHTTDASNRQPLLTTIEVLSSLPHQYEATAQPGVVLQRQADRVQELSQHAADSVKPLFLKRVHEIEQAQAVLERLPARDAEVDGMSKWEQVHKEYGDNLQLVRQDIEELMSTKDPSTEPVGASYLLYDRWRRGAWICAAKEQDQLGRSTEAMPFLAHLATQVYTTFDALSMDRFNRYAKTFDYDVVEQAPDLSQMVTLVQTYLDNAAAKKTIYREVAQSFRRQAQELHELRLQQPDSSSAIITQLGEMIRTVASQVDRIMIDQNKLLHQDITTQQWYDDIASHLPTIMRGIYGLHAMRERCLASADLAEQNRTSLTDEQLINVIQEQLDEGHQAEFTRLRTGSLGEQLLAKDRMQRAYDAISAGEVQLSSSADLQAALQLALEVNALTMCINKQAVQDQFTLEPDDAVVLTAADALDTNDPDWLEKIMKMYEAADHVSAELYQQLRDQAEPDPTLVQRLVSAEILQRRLLNISDKKTPVSERQSPATPEQFCYGLAWETAMHTGRLLDVLQRAGFITGQDDLITQLQKAEKLYEFDRALYRAEEVIDQLDHSATAEYVQLFRSWFEQYHARERSMTVEHQYPLAEGQTVMVRQRGPLEHAPVLDIVLKDAHRELPLTDFCPPGTVIVADVPTAGDKPKFAADVQNKIVRVPFGVMSVREQFTKGLLAVAHEIGHLYQEDMLEYENSHDQTIARADALKARARLERNAWARAFVLGKSIKTKYGFDIFAQSGGAFHTYQTEVRTALGTYQLGAQLEMGKQSEEAVAAVEKIFSRQPPTREAFYLFLTGNTGSQFYDVD